MTEKSIFPSCPSEKLAKYALGILFLGLLFEVGFSWFSQVSFGTLSLFLYDQNRQFSDFTEWFINLSDPHFKSEVPPLGIMFMGIWVWVGNMTSPGLVLVLYTLLWIIALIAGIYLLLNDGEGFSPKWLFYACGIVLFSYPTIFCIDRGNMAGYVTAALAFGVYFYRREKYRRSMLGVALAANIKLIPIVFLAIPFAQRRWSLVADYTIVTFVVLVVAFGALRLTYFSDYMPAHNFSVMHWYYDNYVIGDLGLLWGESLYALGKNVLRLILPTGSYESAVLQWITYYNIAACLLTLAVAVLMILKRPPFVHSLIILTCWMLMVPHVMAYYYLALLMVPLALCIREGMPKRYVILLCLILIPKEYSCCMDIMTGAYLTPLLIAALFCLCVYDVLKSSRARVQ